MSCLVGGSTPTGTHGVAGLGWCSCTPVGVLPFCASLILGHAWIAAPPHCVFHELLPQFSVTDVSARTTMKGAAKCDKHFELQNSVSQQGLERSLRFRDIPGSMPASVSTVYYPSSVDPFYGKGLVAACHCASACLLPLTWPVHGSSFWSAGC